MTNQNEPSVKTPDGSMILHGTTVALQGRAALIRGASGSGKSSLALSLLALGCGLVSDDRTVVRGIDAGLVVDAPETLRGMIEARGVGILRAPPVGPTPLAVVVDMDTPEEARLPQWHETILLGQSVPLLRRVDAAHFAPAIMLYLAHGREA